MKTNVEGKKQNYDLVLAAKKQEESRGNIYLRKQNKVFPRLQPQRTKLIVGTALTLLLIALPLTFPQRWIQHNLKNQYIWRLISSIRGRKNYINRFIHYQFSETNSFV